MAFRQLASRLPWRSGQIRLFSSPTNSAVPYTNTLKNDKTQAPQKIPDSADVVIIGGGVIGCSTMYHLAKMGYTNVVLLEKDQLTAGTSWHTGGLVWRLRPNDTDIVLLNHTRHLLHHVLEEETGINPGWINNGGLFIANSRERLDEYKRLMTIGKVFGIESHVLSPEETKNLYPLMNVSDLYSTLYSPGDGSVDPAGFCTALSRHALKAGAKILEKCPVVGLEVREDDLGVKRIQGVITPSGTISTSCIVNCTGVWAPHIGKMAGVKVPLVPIKHAYVVTNRIENIQGTPNIRDHDLSIYIKLQGDALAIGGYEPNPEFIDHVPDDFAFSLYELNWDVFGTHIEQAIHRIPVLKDTGIKSTVCGPESFTPDHKPLLGEDPVVRGFYHGCGFNSLGMNAGGGCGRELARWLVHGRPQLDMYAYDIRRFHPKLLDNQRWIKERSHEAYAKNYSVVYPHDEPLAGRNQIKDSLYDDMLQSGCIFQERLGWERPGWFEPSGTFPVKEYDYYGNYDVSRHKDYKYEEKLKQDYSFDFPKHHYLIKKECLGCRENVAVFNMSYFGKYYLTGPDAQAAADWIFSNNVNRPAGKSIYTCMLNKRGRVESDLVVSVLEPGSGGVCEPSFDGRGFYITAAGGTAQQNLIHIQQTVQDKGFNVTIADHSQDMGMLSVQGPRSRELLQSLTDTDLDDDKFPFGTNRLMLLDGHKVRALRLTFVGELGWELHIPRNSCTPVYRAIMAAGARYGVVNAGYRAIDSLSCEKGYRHWHADLRLDDNPLEAGLGFTCKLSGDTPFLGREALEGSEEPRKRLVGFTVPMDVALWGLEAIWRNDRLAGWVRRAEFGHSLGQGVAWGYISDRGRPVSANWITEGEYRLESRGELVPAGVHLTCPLDPRHRRVRGDYSEPLPVNSD